MSIAEPQSLALRSLGDIAASLPGSTAVPDGACDSWRALYAGLAKLAEDLTDHIHIENNILFPRFEA